MYGSGAPAGRASGGGTSCGGAISIDCSGSIFPVERCALIAFAVALTSDSLTIGGRPGVGITFDTRSDTGVDGGAPPIGLGFDGRGGGGRGGLFSEVLMNPAPQRKRRTSTC